METIRYNNEWPWGTDIVHIWNDGLGTIGVCMESGYDFCIIHDLFVHETAQKQGRGQYLLDTAEWEIIHTFKRRYAVLRAIEGSWVEQWYKRNGYVEWHDGPLGYPNDGYIELRKEL